MSRRDDVMAAAVTAASLALMTVSAARMPDRWPWIWASLVSAVPFLLLLSPAVQDASRRMVTRRPRTAWMIGAVVAAAGLAIALASGTVPPVRMVLWPVGIAAAFWAVGSAKAGTVGGWRLLAGALSLGVTAGIWDRALKIPVPGGQTIGLTFFAAVGLALFLYRAVRPLDTMKVGLALPGRDAGMALGAFLTVLAVALPTGFLIDFLAFNPQIAGPGAGAARLLGLIIFVGIPEELLFRGLIQEGLGRLTTSRTGWLIASAVFGLSHITKKTGLSAVQRTELFGLNWRYALLATIAGLGYGWVYRKTGRVSAAALTHGLVNWVWSGYFIH